MSVDGNYMSGMGEFDAEEKESRKPNYRFHGVVRAEKNGEGKGQGRGRRNR